jgi:hypothetical protein
MWPFGRKNEPVDESRCASCGRTLLAGEWTQRIIEDDGSEALICSLCSQSRSGRSAPVDTVMADGDQRLPTNGRETKRKSDAFWLALKEKDAEIEDLRARLARTEAEKEGILAELALVRGAGVAALAAPGTDGDATALEAVSGPEAAGVLEAAVEPGATPAAVAADIVALLLVFTNLFHAGGTAGVVPATFAAARLVMNGMMLAPTFAVKA